MKYVKKGRKNKSMSLSMVVPSYKDGKIIQKNLLKVKNVLDQIGYSYEIICVIDGQVDNSFKKAQAVAKRYPSKIKITGYLTNMGKGHAVRYGMASAKGDIIGFIDAGIELNPNSISLLLNHFEWYNADIIVGSKRHPASKVSYPTKRRIMSIGYQLLGRLLFGFKIKDTQVGLKLFRRKVLQDTLPRLLVKRYAFDVETLAVANYLGYNRIFEAPIELQYDFGDIIHASNWKNIFWMLWDTMAVFYRLRILKYYDDKNKKNWITPTYLTLKKS